MTDGGIVVVLVTAPSLEVAEQVVTTVVEERLAACGNIVPGLRSIYRWQDAVQKDDEVLVLFKTTQETARELMGRVAEIHPYEVPEAIALPVVAGLPSYLAWVAASSAG